MCIGVLRVILDNKVFHNETQIFIFQFAEEAAKTYGIRNGP